MEILHSCLHGNTVMIIWLFNTAYTVNIGVGIYHLLSTLCSLASKNWQMPGLLYSSVVPMLKFYKDYNTIFCTLHHFPLEMPGNVKTEWVVRMCKLYNIMVTFQMPRHLLYHISKYQQVITIQRLFSVYANIWKVLSDKLVPFFGFSVVTLIMNAHPWHQLM